MLPAPLYLDTARLGTMSPGAQRLHNQFVRLAAEQPSSLYVEKFLKDGFAGWPTDYRQQYAGLADWTGIARLQSDLARTISTTTQGRVILASRSSALMQLAARRLCQRCRHVLTTDLSWRPYQRILQRTARHCGETRITTIPIRQSILRNGIEPDELTDLLAAAYLRHGCDGLFLPVVDNFGIHLPIACIVSAIRERADVHFVVADAAQAIGHVALEDDAAGCDMLVAGSHKWLRAYLPLGIGWLRLRTSSDDARQSRYSDEDLVDLNDPLFQFAEQLASGSLRRHSETVNLAPLFACRGALTDLATGDATDPFQTQLRNADIVAQLARHAGWTLLRPHRSFQTGILLLRHSTAINLRADEIRRRLLDRGVVASAYNGGLVRLAMPRRPLLHDEIAQLQQALETTGMRPREPAAVPGPRDVIPSA